jgi:ABC-type uncharacterized transport system permease subunit
LAFLNYLVYFLQKHEWSQRSVTNLARGVVAFHAVYLLLSTIVFRHVPLANVWEAFSFIAFALALVYLFLEWWMKDKATGVFLLVPPLFFQIISSAFITHSTQVSPILRSPLFGFHVMSALLGYAAFAIAAVYGMLYLLQYRELKGSSVGLIFQRLPNLEIMSRLILGALIFGWCMLTLAIVVGSEWSLQLLSSGQIDNPFIDPKFLSTVVIWLIYGICIGGRYILNWPSRILAMISLLAFLMMVASTFAVNLFISSFHSFG